MSATAIKALIVDDEDLARRRLKTLLREDPEIEIAGECRNAVEAIQAVLMHRPALMFLDVQMPGMDGFAVLQALEQHERPLTIFVTAYDEYAIKAFEFHALDYLLKPFNRQRFVKALQRAKGLLQQEQSGALQKKLHSLLEDVQRNLERPARIVVQTAGRVHFVNLADIDWVQAAGNYVELHVGGQKHLLRKSLAEMAARLDTAYFIRIHRSILINIARIREMRRTPNGDFAIYLKDGSQFTSGRSYRTNLQALLKSDF